MSVQIVGMGSERVIVPSKDEIVIVPPFDPLRASHRTVTKLRFNNNDSGDLLPRFKVRDTDPDEIAAGRELVDLHTERTVPTLGFMEACNNIYVMATATQSIVLELDTDPTDQDNLPVVTANWIDQYVIGI